MWIDSASTPDDVHWFEELIMAAEAAADPHLLRIGDGAPRELYLVWIFEV